jgi:undecaprenyl-diphosphatase
LVTLTAATGYKALKDGPLMVQTYSAGSVTVGFVAAAVAAAVAVAWTLHYLRRRGLAVFGYYRIGLAVVVAILLWSGRLAP